MKQENRGGKRDGSGRPKGTNKPYLVRCHEKVIKDVRKYAKEQSEKYLDGLKKNS